MRRLLYWIIANSFSLKYQAKLRLLFLFPSMRCHPKPTYIRLLVSRWRQIEKKTRPSSRISIEGKTRGTFEWKMSRRGRIGWGWTAKVYPNKFWAFIFQNIQTFDILNWWSWTFPPLPSLLIFCTWLLWSRVIAHVPVPLIRALCSKYSNKPRENTSFYVFDKDSLLPTHQNPL